MRIALAQINPIIGDVPGNVAKMAAAIDQAAAGGAELVVFGELSVCGYPPRDLLLRGGFIEQNLAALEELAGHCRSVAALVGFVQRNASPSGRTLHNAAALLAGGRIAATHVKTLLPTYDVFDETRYFQPGPPPAPLAWGDRRIGVTICEDLWDSDALGRDLYGDDPVARLADQGADLLVNMSASPYQVGKHHRRLDLLRRRARRFGRPVVYVNQVGGNDELLFDGASCVAGADGTILAQARDFDEQVLVVDLDGPHPPPEPVRQGPASLKAALETGLRDYVVKCGFSKVVLGLSGGIDSALVATIAADALGGANVVGVAMPSRFSSGHSLDDARTLAANLGIDFRVIGIEPMHAAFEAALAESFGGRESDLAEENIQARTRGMIVMALSNKFGYLPLATGNKSELSTGYCTLYGDMCGGMSVIGDVPKMMIYELCRHINAVAGRDRIPASTLTKPPSAELRPNQTDQDSLPPYPVLDAILERYIEREMDAPAIVAAGFDPATVRRVIHLVDRTEYKRRQAPPVLKVTGRAFGSGRRIPIAQRLRHP
ncbi:MAG: NAD+ synthase [Planctomycetes bacterium]|nr:NAD+ synthase [Planctomycetota bacterium]